jgi:hypothetical protein
MKTNTQTTNYYEEKEEESFSGGFQKGIRSVEDRRVFRRESAQYQGLTSKSIRKAWK